jgi:CRP/FNR family transcriptional regulator
VSWSGFLVVLYPYVFCWQWNTGNPVYVGIRLVRILEAVQKTSLGDKTMPNVVNLNNESLRCRNCRHNTDCALSATPGQVGVKGAAQARVLHRGDRLHGEGENADTIYRVRTGTVKTSVTDTDGREQVTGFFGPGEFVGLDALYEEHYASEATALDTTLVCVISRGSLNRLTAAEPQRIPQLMRALGQRAREGGAMHMSLAQDAAASRMAHFLLDLSARRTEAGLVGDDVTLCMPRCDIANYLALAPETASRLLTAMQRDGLVEVSRASVRIVDQDGLLALAGGKRFFYSRAALPRQARREARTA